MNIRSYDLNGDQVAELILALEGSDEQRSKWLDRLRKWVGHRNTKLEILGLAERWFKEYALKTGVHKGRHDWDTDEQNLMDWVYYMMEYTNGLTWDEATNSVIVHKYASSRPLMSPETTQVLLDFITEEMRKRTI